MTKNRELQYEPGFSNPTIIDKLKAENAKLKMHTSFNCSSCTTMEENKRLKKDFLEERETARIYEDRVNQLKKELKTIRGEA